jgi:hypothetical protein
MDKVAPHFAPLAIFLEDFGVADVVSQPKVPNYAARAT